MTLRELQYLVAVADTGHFGQAAERSHASQPTLSAQIKKLEERLGVILIERGQRRASLTPVGELIVERAREILASAGEIEATARAARDPLAGPFRLGIIPTLAPYLLPQVLGEVKAVLPKIEWSFEEDLTDNLIKRLRERALDAAILAAPIVEQGLTSSHLFHEPFMLAVGKDTELARKAEITLKDLQQSNLLLLAEGHCLRGQVEALCHLPAVRSIPQGENFDAVSLETLRELVSGGLGCTLLPYLACLKAEQDPGLTLRRLEHLKAGRDLVLVTRSGYPRKVVLDHLADSLKEKMENRLKLA